MHLPDTIEHLATAALVPYARNSRTHSIEQIGKVADTVLDLFGGSGSTLIACERTGRINRSMELDPKYCDVIVRRWQQYTGRRATHAVTGTAFPD